MLHKKTGTGMKKNIQLVKPNNNTTSNSNLAKPNKDNKNSKSEVIKAQGGEGCLPIR